MARSAPTWNERIRRLRDVGPVALARSPPSIPSGPLIAVTSSRLGRDASLHRHACKFLCRSLIDCRQRGGTLLIAAESAIAPWAIRAAELFAVPLLTLSVAPRQTSSDIVVSSTAGEISSDLVAIAIADRVDAVYVRRGGRIEHCLRSRIEDRADVSTRVAVSALGRCAAIRLIAAGGIGWFHCRVQGGSGCRQYDLRRYGRGSYGHLCRSLDSNRWPVVDSLHSRMQRPVAWRNRAAISRFNFVGRRGLCAARPSRRLDSDYPVGANRGSGDGDHQEILGGLFFRAPAPRPLGAAVLSSAPGALGLRAVRNRDSHVRCQATRNSAGHLRRTRNSLSAGARPTFSISSARQDL